MSSLKFKLSLLLLAISLWAGCNSSNRSDRSQDLAGTSGAVAEKPGEQAKTVHSANQRQTAPDFSLKDLKGEVTRLSNLKDKVVVIHFATTWCPFCNAEAPYLEQLYQDYRDRNVEVLIIDVKEPAALVQEKLQDQFNFSFKVLLDEDGSVATSYCPPESQPDLPRDEVMIASNLIIDTQGKIRFFSLLDSKAFDAKLTDLKRSLDELLVAG